jgi:serine/threonine protein kinase/Tol biopolymer transport system component
MPLSAGEKLGPYEILAPIGAGGMGEVYRARDTKLKRDVALKVLPDSFARDPERMARFQREAEVLASLNHPNIAQIYGIEDRALVMELVEGQTLQGPLPLETALNYGRQIADALEAAHDKGIIHRDLKPANIMITPAGVVKVLDFGLAAVAQSSDSSNPANSPTLTISPTRAGTILGTAAYMSPEQARGKAVDRRADIWAFGVVLFEMLTGQRLFAGETVSDTLAAVLKEEPDWTRVPVKVRRLLKACLQKDPKQRLQAIGDWRLLLTDEQPSPTATKRKLPWLAAALLAVVAGVALWAPWRATRPLEHPLIRLDVDLGSDVSLPGPGPAGTRNSVSIPPDGTRLAYVASVSGGPPRLLTRRLDQPKAIELPGTEGASQPFFSPDGQWIGFSTGAKLNKISVEGGAVVPLGEASSFPGASWGEDGIVLGGAGPGLVRIPSGGGAAMPVTDMRKGETGHGLPQILPGGNAVLFVVYTTSYDADNATIEVVSLKDHVRKILLRGGTSPYYLPSGHLVYVNKGTLFAIPFDLDRLETRGTAVPVLDGIAQGQDGLAHLDFSRSLTGPGALVYRKSSGGGPQMSTIQWLDGAGKKEPLLAKPGNYRDPRLSPDGRRLALSVGEGGRQDIWVYDLQRDAMTRLTVDGSYISPIWSPDGQYIVFTSYAGPLFWTRADGGGQPQAMTEGKNPQRAFSFSPDGQRLAYQELSGPGTSSMKIWTLPVAEDGGQFRAGKPELFVGTEGFALDPEFSPDGRWLAYESGERGSAREVFVRAFPAPASGQGGRWQISNGGAQFPVWSRNGHELLYWSGDRIMAVSYTVKGEVFVPEKPRVWVSKLGGSPAFDLAPDGKRIAVVTPVESAEAPKQEHDVVFIENFFDELRRRAPTGK